MHKPQRGGTIVGFIIGLVVGLGIALVVAVYVTKVPVPFMNKGVIRSPGQDAQEDQKNKNWDPNAPLYGKTRRRSRSRPRKLLRARGHGRARAGRSRDHRFQH